MTEQISHSHIHSKARELGKRHKRALRNVKRRSEPSGIWLVNRDEVDGNIAKKRAAQQPEPKLLKSPHELSPHARDAFDTVAQEVGYTPLPPTVPLMHKPQILTIIRESFARIGSIFKR